MNDFFKSFGTYGKEAQFASVLFWALPICTVLFIWLLTVVGLKIFTKRKKMKTVFVVNRAWMLSSLIVAAIIIGLTCFWWTKNYFGEHPLQLSLLASLCISMVIPIFCLLNLRNYYTAEGIKEITDQPKTPTQLDATIIYAKKIYRNNKRLYLIPLIGFAFLLFYFNKGENLISLVYDNSASMQATSAADALSETFDNLEDNNEITLTTLEGLKETDPVQSFKVTLNHLMIVGKSSGLKAGNVASFNTPRDAKNGLTQISNMCYGSPVCEGIWKTYLYLKESKANQDYKKKLLIIITDGDDNLMGNSLTEGRFFFDDNGFAEFFPTTNVFIIDYSNGQINPFFKRFQNAGCEIFNVENNKQAYLDALDSALQEFKNNWFLIFWVVLVVFILTLVGLLIQPKKIV